VGVHKVAPRHCTGDRARQAFMDAFRVGFIPVEVGLVITVGL
jgi:metal-dependent hydrolase (beta-lactamase superfamily II)